MYVVSSTFIHFIFPGSFISLTKLQSIRPQKTWWSETKQISNTTSVSNAPNLLPYSVLRSTWRIGRAAKLPSLFAQYTSSPSFHLISMISAVWFLTWILRYHSLMALHGPKGHCSQLQQSVLRSYFCENSRTNKTMVWNILGCSVKKYSAIFWQALRAVRK